MRLKPKEAMALLYCRVSSKGQTTDGSGLDSQEYRCHKRAEELKLPVDAVFYDDVSGGSDFMKRRGIVALLAHLDANPDILFYIIFDDMKRFARDSEFHLKLTREIEARDAIRECLNHQFDSSPEGKFLETILAAQNELERMQNVRQVNQKIVARAEQGYWVFHTGPGYRYQKCKSGGKILVPHDPVASILREVLEGFASGRFQNQVEVMRFLQHHGIFTNNKAGKVLPYQVTRLLTNPLYAGYVQCEKWGISLRKGQHEGIISFETFQKNQERLKGISYAPTRQDISKEFILRGFVDCGCCNNPLTSSWSKSKSGKMHAHYRCFNKSCEKYGKSIRRAQVEGDFAEIVRSLQPTPVALQIAAKMFQKIWQGKLAQSDAIVRDLKKQALAIDEKIEALIDRVIETTVPTVATRLEQSIVKLEKDKLVLTEKIENTGQPKHSFDKVFEHAMAFLSSPWKLWESDDFALPVHY